MTASDFQREGPILRTDLPIEGSALLAGRSGLVIWAIVAALAVAAVSGLAAADLSVNLRSGAGIATAILGFGAIAGLYRTLRPSPRLSQGAESAAQLSCLLLFAGLLTHGLAVFGADVPYRDAVLQGADRGLGFDWVPLNGFVDSHPSVGLVLQLAYESIGWQIAGVVIALAAARRRERLQGFVLATGLTLAATCAIFPFVPALGYHQSLGLGRSLWGVALEALRAGTLSEIHLDAIQGIVAFPSFHTAAAILLAWAWWGIRWLRWPALALDATMIAATPFLGSHYLVDLLAGTLVAGVAIAAATRLAGRTDSGRRPVMGITSPGP